VLLRRWRCGCARRAIGSTANTDDHSFRHYVWHARIQYTRSHYARPRYVPRPDPWLGDACADQDHEATGEPEDDISASSTASASCERSTFRDLR
jgi:hypothetical protein